MTEQLSRFVQPGRVHRQIYTDPAIFEIELERIFGTAWIYIGHESQVKNPGDFLATRIGRKPLLLVRDAAGQLQLLHNQCAHRGGPVCQGRIYRQVREPVDENGETRMLQHDPNSKNIVCPWHGWEFDLRTGRHPGGERFALRRAKLEIADGHVYVVV